MRQRAVFGQVPRGHAGAPLLRALPGWCPRIVIFELSGENNWCKSRRIVYACPMITTTHITSRRRQG
jgi:hypothetical protein